MEEPRPASGSSCESQPYSSTQPTTSRRTWPRPSGLVRAAAADGAELIGLPEKWNILGPPDALRAGAEPLDGPTLTAVAEWARELGVAILAGSITEAGGEQLHNTSVLIDRDGSRLAAYRKIHMFDVDVGGVAYRESEVEQAGDEIVEATVEVGAAELVVGLSICYDLRFPELYRILALRGARLLTVPAAFTIPTGSAHWEPLLRARAIENQAFVLAPGQVGPGAAPLRLLGPLDDRRPVGRGPRPGRARRGLRGRRPGSRRAGANPHRGPVARQPPPALVPLARVGGGSRLMAKAPPADRRRQILDAGIRVFARQGFHSCRVSDIADEAGVAYGLVYHYFKSKDQVMNELFTERWSLLLAAIEEVDAEDVSGRQKLDTVARFIIESYRYDPELMKVIIVEVTRAANSFGRTHLPDIRRAYESIAKIVSGAQKSGEFRSDIDPMIASMWFYGAIEQLLSGWVFELIPAGDGDFDRAREMVVESICGGLEAAPSPS